MTFLKHKQVYPFILVKSMVLSYIFLEFIIITSIEIIILLKLLQLWNIKFVHDFNEVFERDACHFYLVGGHVSWREINGFYILLWEPFIEVVLQSCMSKH